MPLYVGDYLADTAHLRAVEHGAYLLLIMHYWRTQGLPSDDAALARIARVTNAEWKKIKPVIKTLFSDGWKHKRIEFEMTQAAIISEAGKRGGKASGAARRCKSLKTLDQNERPFNDRSTTVQRNANDQPTKREALQPQPQPQKEEEDCAIAPDPSIAEREYFKRGRQVLGQKSGSLLGKLLNFKGKNVALARAVIEEASQKDNSLEWIGAHLRGPPSYPAKPLTEFQRKQQEATDYGTKLKAVADSIGSGGTIDRILSDYRGQQSGNLSDGIGATVLRLSRTPHSGGD